MYSWHYKVMKSQQKVTPERCNNANEESDLLEIHALFENDEINQTTEEDQLTTLRRIKKRKKNQKNAQQNLPT